MDSDWKTWRAAVRTKCNSMQTQIDNASDVDALAALFTYTEQEDGSVRKGKVTKLSTKSKQASEWLENIPKVEDLYTLKSYDEITGILENWINGDEETVASEGTAHRSTPPSTNTTADATTKTTESESFGSLDDAFADLMD